MSTSFDYNTAERSMPEQTAPLPAHSTDHPLFHQVQTLIKHGDWQAALAPLAELLDLYPRDPYLRELSASAQARSALLSPTQPVVGVSVREPGLRRGARILLGAVVLVLVLVLVAGGVFITRTWVMPQFADRSQALQVDRLRQQAEAALASGDYNRAVLAYNNLLELLPGDTAAETGLAQANELRTLVSKYSEAIAEMEAHHWDGALALLWEIESQQPGYRDVQARIEFVQQQQALADRFAEAEVIFERGDYEQAIAAYEAVQEIDYNYQRQPIQDNLFFSYLQLGLAEIDAAGSDTAQLEAALEKFEKALALRPDDSRVRGETQLLKQYLAGLAEFQEQNWSQATADLATVYDAQPEFAAGQAAQLLYTAYVSHGDELMAAERYDKARSQYEAAQQIRGVNSAGLQQKITQVELALAPPTPTPVPTATPVVVASTGGSSGGRTAPAPVPTPRSWPFTLKGMSMRNNCSGSGYIHGVVWNVYNLPVPGITVKATNTTTGYGPMVANPTNQDGIYQIIIPGDQIAGLWMVQVLGGDGQPLSEPLGQRLGGECLNGAQELKVDWLYTLQND